MACKEFDDMGRCERQLAASNVRLANGNVWSDADGASRCGRTSFRAATKAAATTTWGAALSGGYVGQPKFPSLLTI
jgi:hypothetical protein